MKKTAFILGAALLAGTATQAFSQQSANAQIQYVRKNASTPEAQPDMEALKTALGKMRAMGCDDPRSWYYQGAIHWVPNSFPDKKNPLCPSYINNTQLKWAWDNCTHAKGSEIHFLLWHRLYTLHFEEIVRKLSGKADFALPYWDYTNPKYRVMPTLMRLPTDQASNSLFEPARLPSLNAGQAIQGDEIDQALDIRQLFKNTVYSVFNSNIDAAPHGAMHDYIGGGYPPEINVWNQIYRTNMTGLMANVPSAAFDPIFWLHHSNIDYLWQWWENTPNGSRPLLTELEAKPWPYQFIDADGKQVTYTIAQAYTAAFNVNYTYDQLITPVQRLETAGHNLLIARHGKQTRKELWSEKINKNLLKGVLSVEPSAAKKLSNKGLRSLAATPNALVLQLDVSFKKEPRTAYEVLLENPNGTQTRIGIMTFFGAAHHAQAHGHHHDNKSGKISKEFVFDVSNEINTDKSYKVLIKDLGNHKSSLTLDAVTLLAY